MTVVSIVSCGPQPVIYSSSPYLLRELQAPSDHTLPAMGVAGCQGPHLACPRCCRLSGTTPCLPRLFQAFRDHTLSALGVTGCQGTNLACLGCCRLSAPTRPYLQPTPGAADPPAPTVCPPRVLQVPGTNTYFRSATCNLEVLVCVYSP